MAQEVGGLLVNIGLDVAQIKQDVGKAQRELSGFRNKVDRQMGKMQRSFKKATSGLKGLVAVMGGAALVRNINRAAEGLENVNRAAESLDAQRSTIQELTFAFKEYRLQQDDVTDALGTLSDRAQDAKDGMKSFQEDFELVGITVDDLRDKDPGELFELFAEKIAKVDDPTRRTAAAVRIFGDDLGRNLLPMLMKGREGLKEYAEQAREVGAVQSDSLVKQGAEAAKTMRELQATLGAQFTRAVANNAEEIETFASNMTTLAVETAKAANEISNFLSGPGEFDKTDQKVQEIQKELMRVRKEQFRLIDDGEREVAEFMDRRIEELQRKLNRLGEKTIEQIAKADVASKGIFSGDFSVDSGDDAAGGGSRGSDAIVLRSLRRGSSARRSGSNFAKLIEIQKDAAEQARKTGDTFIETQNNIQNNQVEVNQTFQRTGEIVADSLSAATREGTTLRGVMQGLLRDLAQMQVSKAAGNIGQSVTNALSASFGGGASSTGGALASVGGVGGATPRAEGGPVRQGERYLVGEKGPELFTPGRSGGITPNDKIGGGTVILTYNIDATGADKAAVEDLKRTIKAVSASVEPRAVRAVGSQRQRSFRG